MQNIIHLPIRLLQNQFPQNQNLHFIFMSVVWSLFIDVAILFTLFKYKAYWFYIHAALAWIVVAFTLASQLLLIVPLGVFIQAGEGVMQNIHSSLGLILLGLLGAQIISGALTKNYQQSGTAKPQTMFKLKKIHQIIGFSIIAITKFNILNNRNSTITFVLILVFQIIFWSFFISKKVNRNKLLHTIVDQQTIQIDQVKGIQSESFIPVDKKYIIFADYVYDLQNVKQKHPGGQAIVSQINKREIDRFLYGMYSIELNPQILPYQHTAKCLSLAGPPIARINRLSSLIGINDYNQCVISSLVKVSLPSPIFIVRLRLTQLFDNFMYDGYQSLSQLGQYFSLSIQNKLTRLYTSVFCMRKHNLLFMQTNFPGSVKLEKPGNQTQSNNNATFKENLQQTTQRPALQMNQINQELTQPENNSQKVQTIPLLIKKYDQGKLTPQLFDRDFNQKLIISRPKGCGMKYNTISSEGKVVIVAGGTGMFPFIDFIDLLFKKVLIQEGHFSKETLIRQNPVLKEDIFRKNQFLVLVAINSSLDLPSVVFYQCNYLAASDKIRFKTTFKVNKDIEVMTKSYPNITLTKKRFEDNLLQETRLNLAMMYICGPPIMNHKVTKLMVDNHVSAQKYHLL